MRNRSNGTWWIIVKTVMSFVLAGVVQAGDSGDNVQELVALRAAGARASLTVFPFALGGRPIPEVGTVVAVMMEQFGVEDVGTDETAFRPVAGAGFEEVASDFGKFVRDRGIERQYALYGEYLGSRAGINEVRAVLVDREGNVVWVDRQAPGDADFDRVDPHDPMGCCLLLAERLKGAMALPEVPLEREQGAGWFEREMARKAGVPEESEFAAMEERGTLFGDRFAEASIVVYPVRIRGELNRDQAEHVATLLGKAGFGEVRVAETKLPIEVAPARNEQKMLWTLARSFRDHVRAHPPKADYAMYADYLMASPEGPVGAVHFVICDRKGEWVIVDLQNSHHEDFQSIAPDSATDCSRLAAKRLTRYIR